MFVCLFVWGLSSHSKIFHSYWDVTITGEGLQILTYARHSWPLSNKGISVTHLLWHGAFVYNGRLQGPVTLTQVYCGAFSSGAVTTCFYDLGMSRPEFEHPNFRLGGGQRSYPLLNRRGFLTRIPLKCYVYECICETHAYVHKKQS